LPRRCGLSNGLLSRFSGGFPPDTLAFSALLGVLFPFSGLLVPARRNLLTVQRLLIIIPRFLGIVSRLPVIIPRLLVIFPRLLATAQRLLAIFPRLLATTQRLSVIIPKLPATAQRSHRTAQISLFISRRARVNAHRVIT
jgi:hypothetical protein